MAKSGQPVKKQSLGDRVKALESYAKSMQMALSMAQNLIMKLNNGIARLDGDVGNLTGLTQELEYRTMALIHYDGSNVNIGSLDEKAYELKLKAFDEASDREDTEQGFVTAAQSNADSIVIFTSSVEGKEEAGVFRSKIPLKEALFPELREKLTGVKVGDKVDVNINDELHHVEVLGIREKLPQVEADGVK